MLAAVLAAVVTASSAAAPSAVLASTATPASAAPAVKQRIPIQEKIAREHEAWLVSLAREQIAQGPRASSRALPH